MAGATERIVVVGGGIAGQSLCEAVRERDPDVAITLVCAEPHAPYDRVHLSELLAAGAPVDLQLRPDEWYTDRQVEVLVGSPVERIDLADRTVALGGGRRRRFDKLALATGSRPVVPAIPGVDLENVYSYRTPEDCARIAA